LPCACVSEGRLLWSGLGLTLTPPTCHANLTHPAPSPCLGILPGHGQALRKEAYFCVTAAQRQKVEAMSQLTSMGCVPSVFSGWFRHHRPKLTRIVCGYFVPLYDPGSRMGGSSGRSTPAMVTSKRRQRGWLAGSVDHQRTLNKGLYFKQSKSSRRSRPPNSGVLPLRCGFLRLSWRSFVDEIEGRCFIGVAMVTLINAETATVTAVICLGCRNNRRSHRRCQPQQYRHGVTAVVNPTAGPPCTWLLGET
jgi:hypothetical protein